MLTARGRRGPVARRHRPVRRRAPATSPTISCCEAARALGADDVALTLDKSLPVAAGLGGGSADAAAALRLLARRGPHATIAAALGADVPACLLSRTARGEGRGDRIEPVEIGGLAGTPVLLVNPGIPLVDRRRVRGLGRRRPRPARRLGGRPQRPRSAGPRGWSRRSATCSTRSPAPASRACRARARPASGCYDKRGRARRRRGRGSPPRIPAGGCPKPGFADPRSPVPAQGLTAVNHRKPQESVLARLLLCIRPTGRGAVVIAPTFARGPPPPPDGAPRNILAGLPRIGQPGLFLRDKRRRPRHVRAPCSASNATTIMPG